MEALLDTPAEVEVEEIDLPAETEGDEPAELVLPVDEQQTTERTPEQIEADNKLPLWKQAKPDLEKMENKALATKIKDALFRDQQLAKDFPEGIKSAVALRNEVSSLGQIVGSQGKPAEVLAEVKSQLGFFHQLDSLFTSGDPSFALKLAEASPESFQKLAPAVFAEFSKTNPDGYASYVSQAAISHMNASEVPLAFKTLQFMLPRLADSPEKDAVIAEIEKIFGWTETLKAFAAKPITAPEKKPDDAATLEAQRTELAQREMDVTRQSWNTSFTKFGYDLIGKESARLAGKTTLTDDQKSSIMAKVSDELDARLQVNKDYGEAMRGYIQAKDSEGYKRRLHSEYQKLIPSAVGRAYADVVTSKPRQQAAKPAATPTPINAQSSNGYRPVSKYPVGQVDMVRTSNKDYEAGRLILKDGSKVSFTRRHA